MSTEALDRSSIWADEAVLLLIRIKADEQIIQQLDIGSEKADLREDGLTMDHPVIFSSKKIGNIDSLLGRN